jgi:hypothetical protein
MEAEDETICMLLRGFKNPKRQKARVHAKGNSRKKGTRRPVSDNQVDRRYAQTQSKRTRVQSTNERSQITPNPTTINSCGKLPYYKSGKKKYPATKRIHKPFAEPKMKPVGMRKQ